MPSKPGAGGQAQREPHLKRRARRCHAGLRERARSATRCKRPQAAGGWRGGYGAGPAAPARRNGCGG
eukprot:4077831-Pyramimonas_sp.AAC.1